VAAGTIIIAVYIVGSSEGQERGYINEQKVTGMSFLLFDKNLK
jgi:hypothetical protein